MYLFPNAETDSQRQNKWEIFVRKHCPCFIDLHTLTIHALMSGIKFNYLVRREANRSKTKAG